MTRNEDGLTDPRPLRSLQPPRLDLREEFKDGGEVTAANVPALKGRLAMEVVPEVVEAVDEAEVVLVRR